MLKNKNRGEKKPATLAVLGAGQWGTTLALLGAKTGKQVFLYDRNPERAKQTEQTRENRDYLPGIRLPENIHIKADLKEVCSQATLLLLTVPSSHFREFASELKVLSNRKHLFVHGTKGLEEKSNKRMSTILREELKTREIGALSGPNLALEFARGMHGATVVASPSKNVVTMTQQLLSSSQFRIYGNKDLVGVELSGAFKNILALASGVASEMKLGENTFAMLVCRGLSELSRLIHAMGGKPTTLMGLSGIGDILATCTSPLSRNFRAGKLLARSASLDEIHREIGATIEGLATLPITLRLAKKYRIALPIAEAIQGVLHGKLTIQNAIHALMQRPTTWEFEKERS